MRVHSMVKYAGLGLGSIVSLACQTEMDSPPEAADVKVVKVVKAAVVGGKEVSVCQYPSTVRVEDCTGTLIHPRIVTTAAHCITDGTETIRFGGAVGNDAASFTLTGRCTAGARGESGVGTMNDWAYCVLPEDDRLKQLPITPPLVGCEAERFLKAGSMAWIVGYGTTGPSGQGSGVKRAVEVKVNRVGNGTIDVGDAEVGACHGDSGGPIYMQLTDGANDYGLRVFGSTSGPGANFCDCSCSTVYVDIANHIKAIEQNEHIDVTPCTDSQGNWAPGPECNALQTQAMNGSGTFPSCSVPHTTAPIDSCMKGAAAVAGSGGNSSAMAAGSGALPSAGSSAHQAAASAAAAGTGAAGTSGASVAGALATAGNTAAAASGSAGRSTAVVGTGITATTPAAGASAIGSKTSGISTAGSEGTLGQAGALASSTAEPQDVSTGCSCSVSSTPARSDAWSGFLTLLDGGFLTIRARRRRAH